MVTAAGPDVAGGPPAPDPAGPAFTEYWGRLVAGLIAWCGDFDVAEEAAQEAFASAVTAWAAQGVPDRPLAWLTTAARNAARDRFRRRGLESDRLRVLGAERLAGAPAPGAGAEAGTVTDIADGVADDLDDDLRDDRLRLIFTCCHPALPMPARIALTLRTLCGLTSAEIARAFLVTEPTMDKRLVRARAKIRDAGVPYRVPPAHLLPQRVDGVLAVLYLMFNEGYAASSGDSLVRTDVSAEAIRLTRLVATSMPAEAEATGLLALLLLTDARRPARYVDGRVIGLADQDRTRWRTAAIDEGAALLDRPVPGDGPPGSYTVQALIAYEHDRAQVAADTDWARIAELYGWLPRTPVTELNRAVAVSMADPDRGPAAALAVVEPLGDDLDGYHLFHATRADLLHRLGRHAEATVALDRAIALAPTAPERRLLGERRTAWAVAD